MTDRDIVERVARIWNVKALPIRPQKTHHKASYRARVRGGRAIDWMLHLRPLLGDRRREQIDRVVAGWDGRRSRALGPREIEEILAAVGAGEEPVPQIATRFGVRRETIYWVVRRNANVTPVLGIGEPRGL